MERIQKISILLYYLLLVVIILIPVFAVLKWWQLPYQCATGQTFCFPIVNNTRLVTMFDMGWGSRLALLAITLIPNLLVMVICAYLMQLFKSFHLGEVFSEQNVHLLKRIAQILLLSVLVKPLYDLLMSYTLTWDNPGGQVMLVAGVSMNEFFMLFLSALVFLIAWVMSEAYKLKEEQQYTV